MIIILWQCEGFHHKWHRRVPGLRQVLRTMDSKANEISEQCIHSFHPFPFRNSWQSLQKEGVWGNLFLCFASTMKQCSSLQWLNPKAWPSSCIISFRKSESVCFFPEAMIVDTAATRWPVRLMPMTPHHSERHERSEAAFPKQPFPTSNSFRLSRPLSVADFRRQQTANLLSVTLQILPCKRPKVERNTLNLRHFLLLQNTRRHLSTV